MARFHLDGSYVVCNVCMIFCSWTTTYEDLLLSTEPFQQPITLAVSLVDALFSSSHSHFWNNVDMNIIT